MAMNSNSMGYTAPKKCSECGGVHIHYWVDDNKNEKCIVCVRSKTLKHRAENALVGITIRGRK